MVCHIQLHKFFTLRIAANHINVFCAIDGPCRLWRSYVKILPPIFLHPAAFRDDNPLSLLHNHLSIITDCNVFHTDFHTPDFRVVDPSVVIKKIFGVPSKSGYADLTCIQRFFLR